MTNTVQISNDRFQQLLAQARAKLAAALLPTTAVDYLSQTIDADTAIEVSGASSPEHAEDILLDTLVDTTNSPVSPLLPDIQLNPSQQAAVDSIIAGDDVVIIGAAGTGKTTIQRYSTAAVISRLPTIKIGTKYLQVSSPGAAILSFTNKAVNNIRHVVHPSLRAHTITLHKLLEYKPIWYEIEDGKGGFKNTMRFEPSRNAENPLPSELQLLLFEESSMIGIDIYALLQAAMPHPHQEVFIGDIQQLPPVFGPAILGFKMTTLPVVELTQVYRQEANSPILDLAWSILDGDSDKFSPVTERRENGTDSNGRTVYKQVCPALEQYSRSTDAGEVLFQTWQKSLDADRGLITAIKLFTTWADNGYYNPEEDVILCPYNKAFGTIEFNKGIAQHLGNRREATVHEVIAGFNKHYLAVGDRVLFDKEDAVITGITRNGQYSGEKFRPASQRLNRYGNMVGKATEDEVTADLQSEIAADFDIEDFLDNAASSVAERVQAASHIITIQETYSGEYRELEAAAEINNLLGGYVLTVHKFQGSEAERVFIVLHQSHATLISRELLYTAVTRAKRQLIIIAEKNTFYKGVAAPRIKGNTVAEKAEYFKGKLDAKLATSSKGTLENAQITEATAKAGGLYTVQQKQEIN